MAGTPAVTVGQDQERLKRSGKIVVALLLAPVLVLLLVFFLLPFVLQIGYSFQRYDPATGPLPGMTLQNYLIFFTDAYYLGIWWRTVRVALLCTFFTVVLAYPVALVLARAQGVVKTILLLLTISPLFVSSVIRAYGWMIVLNQGGLLNRALLGLGIIKEPITLMYTETAVVIGLVEVLLPFVILPLSSVLARIDPSLERQAMNLGADRLRTFIHVTFPLSVPGLLAGSILAFILSMGSFVIPALLGGARMKMLAVEAYASASTQSDWGMSSTLGVMLLLTTLLGIGIYSRVLRSPWRQR
jgi:putative spermidine/putrescine transport system permease protein